ncbi:heme-binding protein 2-like [Plakobranchus ocellatus]|uniref:Heme-binding protein 2-like n=1 Tax=Plakobranchus ocellatus TaxID=259542 RepID=A0AAV4C530_9GAST|nr:heme-binding protein 2-like [Plakobranchus ocellatus]
MANSLFTTCFATLILAQCSLGVIRQSDLTGILRINPELIGSQYQFFHGVKPDFCNHLDCPDFTELNKTKDYEERAYRASRWVSTSVEGMDYSAAEEEMFDKLFLYIEGENTKKQVIKMTAPVLTKVIAGSGPACKSNFTMSFYLPPSLKQPPQPTDKTVYFSSLPAQKVFVSYFGGYATESAWLEHAETLAKALVRDSKSFNQDFFFTAGYDSPFKILNRHNEVWYIAE